MSADRFWLVWSPTGRTPPRVRHATRADALAEARRLAGLNPNAEFFVLDAVSRSKAVGVISVPLDAPADPPSFADAHAGLGWPGWPGARMKPMPHHRADVVIAKARNFLLAWREGAAPEIHFAVAALRLAIDDLDGPAR